MKPPLLGLPDEITPLVESTRRCAAPPRAIKDRLRARLDWALAEGRGDNAGQFLQSRTPHAVTLRAEVADRTDRWLKTAARAAAAAIVAHVPLALASLGAVLAAVPVARIAMNRAAESRSGSQSPPQHPQPRHPLPRVESPGALEVPALPALPVPFAPAPAEIRTPPEIGVPGSSSGAVVRSRAPGSSPVAPAAMPTPSPSPVGLSPAPVPVPEPSEPRKPPLGDDLSLGGERQLLDRGRASLVGGNAEEALEELGEHQRRYPDSQLSEEREALTVQALMRSGRVAEARSRLDGFRRNFPNSLLLPALDAAFPNL